MTGTRLDTTQCVTISAGGFLSSVLDLGKSGTLEGITVPSAWTESDITFRVAIEENGPYLDMMDPDGSRITACTKVNTYMALNGIVTRGMRYVKIESSNSQTAERQICVHIRYEV